MLLDWINDVLAEDRIIVKDIEEDLFDGQILQKLIGERIFLRHNKMMFFFSWLKSKTVIKVKLMFWQTNLDINGLNILNKNTVHSFDKM